MGIREIEMIWYVDNAHVYRLPK